MSRMLRLDMVEHGGSCLWGVDIVKGIRCAMWTLSQVPMGRLRLTEANRTASVLPGKAQAGAESPAGKRRLIGSLGCDFVWRTVY